MGAFAPWGSRQSPAEKCCAQLGNKGNTEPGGAGQTAEYGAAAAMPSEQRWNLLHT